MHQTAVIIGSGPAGLTAAYELLARTDIKPVVIECDNQVGGISKTVNYRGNRMDLGGHRFFSKSDWVMNWWQSILPVAESDDAILELGYQGQRRSWTSAIQQANGVEAAMLVRSRLSRIFYRRRFFDYPLRLNRQTLENLGPLYLSEVAATYLWSRISPRRPEVTLEDFLINRFGYKLYNTFFRDYTEKVWGVPCAEISAEWGAQRIKGLSISKAIAHAVRQPFRGRDVHQRDVETSLIERFLYPRLGPGQMWEEVAKRIVKAGGELHLNTRAVGLKRSGNTLHGVEVVDEKSGDRRLLRADWVFSTMPVNSLVSQLQPDDPRIGRIAMQLPYRDFITAGLLVKRMRTGSAAHPTYGLLPDNWIYVQESDVKLGRVQIFNNWSPALVADPNTVWLGLEYFCRQGDELWSMPDGTFVDFAAGELAKIGLIDRADVLDGTVVRVPAAYPAYFGSYHEIAEVRSYLDDFRNLFPIGRNGMHRYNNQDHSMLAAKTAVDLIVAKEADRSSLWAVNTEDDYHEKKVAHG